MDLFFPTVLLKCLFFFEERVRERRDERREKEQLFRTKKNTDEEIFSPSALSPSFSLFFLFCHFLLFCVFFVMRVVLSLVSLSALSFELFFSLCPPHVCHRRPGAAYPTSLVISFISFCFSLQLLKTPSLSLTLSHSFSYYITHNNAKRSISHDYYHAQGAVVPILPRGEDDDFDEEE